MNCWHEFRLEGESRFSTDQSDRKDFECFLEWLDHLSFEAAGRSRGYYSPCGHTDLFARQFDLDLAQHYADFEGFRAIVLGGISSTSDSANWIIRRLILALNGSSDHYRKHPWFILMDHFAYVGSYLSSFLEVVTLLESEKPYHILPFLGRMGYEGAFGFVYRMVGVPLDLRFLHQEAFHADLEVARQTG